MPAQTGPADLPGLLEIDRLNYLPDYILRKADLCTMAHGLELRAPLLDHRFVEVVMGLPPSARSFVLANGGPDLDPTTNAPFRSALTAAFHDGVSTSEVEE